MIKLLNEKNMTSEYISNELCSDGIHSITSVSLNSTLNEERIPDLPVVGDVPENTLKHAQNVSVLQIHQLSQEEINLQEDINIQTIDKRLSTDYLALPLSSDVKYSDNYLCRLCATIIDISSALNIFHSDGFEDNLASKINKYLPVIVYEADPFPKTVCKICVGKLNEIHDLAEKCILVEEQLRRTYVFDRRYLDELTKKINQKSEEELLKHDTQNNEHLYAMPELQYIETLGVSHHSDETAHVDTCKPTETEEIKKSVFDNPENPANFAAEKVDNAGAVEECFEDVSCRYCDEHSKDTEECLRHCSQHDDVASCQYVCSLCEFLTDSQTERDEHVRAHFTETKTDRPPTSRDKTKARQQRILKHKLKIFNKVLCCKKCKESLDGIDKAVEHCIKHRPANIKSYPCVLCVRRVGKTKLREHISLHYPMITKPILTCDNCNNLYPDEKTLKYHRCTKLRKYKCSQCKQGFKSEDRLKFHEDFHKNKSTFCDICKKDFKFESRIYLHFAGVHNGIRDKPYCCDVCGKTFTWLTVLNSHKRTHTNERPFKCGKCDARFCNKYSLSGHMPSHEDYPQFYCDKCDYHTGRKQNLQKHVSRFHKEIHSSQICIRCKMCNEIFPNKHHVDIEGHSARHTEEEVTSSTMLLFQCDASYDSQVFAAELFQELIVTKLYQCERCEKCYGSSEHLAQHRVKHTNDDASSFYQCRLCDNSFPKHDLLVKHQKVHVNITSQYTSKLSVLIVISCDICGIECVDYRQLLNHKDRGNCMMKKISGTVRPKKVLIKKHLKPLKTHQLYVNSNGLFECPSCQRTYKNRRRYRLHLATHANIVL